MAFEQRDNSEVLERRQVVGHPTYEVDEAGNVFSFRKGKWQPKKATLYANGYFSITLWKGSQRFDAYIHHLVLEAFVRPRPLGCEALHRDGDRKNNHASNLRWGTRRENVADMLRHGTAAIGSKNARAKLSRLDILWLRDMRDMGFTPREAATVFCVTPQTIRRVYQGKTYTTEKVYVG